MRPRNPLKLEDCKSREELFDTRIMWFLLEHNEPAKNFRKDGSYVGRLSDYFRDLFHFSVGRVFAGQRAYRKIFLRFFPRSVEGRLLRRKALCNHVQAARLPYGKACGKSQRQTCRTRQQHSRSCFQGGVSVRVGLQKN